MNSIKLKKQLVYILALSFSFLLFNCSESQTETITTNEIGYDIYAKNCNGGIEIKVKSASSTQNMINKKVFLTPADSSFVLPEGLVASGNNELTFYGNFKKTECIHLMGGGESNLEDIFVYDSILITCPYKYFNMENMKFDTLTCGRQPSFHKRIRVLKE